MPKHMLGWALVALLVAAGLIPRPLSLHGQGKPKPESLTDAELAGDLEKELDEIYQDPEFKDPDVPEPDDDLERAILAALKRSDVIDYADLEADMEEDKTTVKQVVEDALQEADSEPSGQRSNTWTLVWVTAVAQGRVRETTASRAVSYVKRGLVQHVDHVRANR